MARRRQCSVLQSTVVVHINEPHARPTNTNTLHRYKPASQLPPRRCPRIRTGGLQSSPLSICYMCGTRRASAPETRRRAEYSAKATERRAWRPSTFLFHFSFKMRGWSSSRGARDRPNHSARGQKETPQTRAGATGATNGRSGCRAGGGGSVCWTATAGAPPLQRRAA